MCKKCIKILFDNCNTVQTTWQEQCKLWSLLPDADIEYTYIYNDEDEIYALDELKTVSQCICSHKIETNYPIYNDSRKICLVLGSSCIKQHKKKGDKEYGIFEDNKEMMKYFDILNSYHCKECNKTFNKKNIEKHNLTPNHINNVKKKNFRICRTCKTYVIPITSPINYNYCKPCMRSYYASKTNYKT